MNHDSILNIIMLFFAGCIVVWLGFWFTQSYLGKWNDPEWRVNWWFTAYQLFIAVAGLLLTAWIQYSITDSLLDTCIFLCYN